MMSKKAVSYLRVSGQSQVDGDGFERQRAAITGRAEASGLILIEEFTDEGISGTLPLSERPGMSSMLERILGNGVRIILVEKADRLARDLIEGELILRGMRKHGISVIEAENGNNLTAGDGDSPTAVLIRQVLGAVAEFEKSALVAKLRAARGRKRRSGKRVEGRKPYGPDVEALVRKLRRRVIDGKPWSYARIATELDRREIPTKNGNPWSFSTVADIVKGRTVMVRGIE